MVGVCCRPANQEVDEPSLDKWKNLVNGESVLTLPWHLLEGGDTGRNQSRRLLELLEDNFLEPSAGQTG